MSKLMLLFVLLLSFSVSSQEEVDQYEVYLKRLNETIDTSFLMGDWQFEDSVKHSIRFEQEGNVFRMKGIELYYFSHADTKAGFSSVGSHAHWPPDYCYVKRLDENTIEVELFDFIGTPEIYHFKRVVN
ncbi:MAG: hypothetical protein QE487_10040 [Fluviicola sp.]|nr:hypothetical protein [Fluviicola sp.]